MEEENGRLEREEGKEVEEVAKEVSSEEVVVEEFLERLESALCERLQTLATAALQCHITIKYIFISI